MRHYNFVPQYRFQYHDNKQRSTLKAIHIAGVRDLADFHGKSVRDLRAAFEEAVDDFLETYEKLGHALQKPT